MEAAAPRQNEAAAPRLNGGARHRGSGDAVTGHRGGGGPARVLGGRYRLIEPVGVGGMATVWRAHDEVLDRAVAVKLLTAAHTADPAAYERARNEARSAARFAHPNIVGVYDFGTSSRRTDRGAAFLVMELVDGSLLNEQMRAGPMDWRLVGRIGAELCAGLAAAHAHGIVHRDVKPLNVVLTPSGAKLLDFGIAAHAGDPETPTDGAVLGTAAYVAPERLCGRTVSAAADMYAMGVLLYQCLTGTLPWPDVRTDDQMLHSHRSVPPQPLPPIDGMAREVAEICEACLDKDPERRPTSVAAALLLAAAVDAQVYVPPVVRHAPTGVGHPPTRGGPVDLSAPTIAHAAE